MKTMCRDIVKFHYRAELDPEIEYGHCKVVIPGRTGTELRYTLEGRNAGNG